MESHLIGPLEHCSLTARLTFAHRWLIIGGSVDTAKPLSISVTRYNQHVLFGDSESEDGMHLSLEEVSRISSKGLALGGPLSGSIHVQNVSHAASSRISGTVTLTAPQVGAQVLTIGSLLAQYWLTIGSGELWGRGVCAP